MSWMRKPLAQVADLCLGKMLDEKKNKGDPLPYLANINVRWGEFDFENLREMRFEHNELDRYGLRNGDIVMCEGGEPGRCAIWKDERPGMMIQKALHRIRPREELDYRFLYYSFLQKGRNNGFSGLFTGSTIKHLPGQNLAKVEVAYPTRPEQERIADLLAAYDDLIENNRRRIQLLEQSARLLYRDWFVRRRFPGHEHVRVVDGVPEGWERKTMADVAETVGGGTPSTSVASYWDDGTVTWFTPSDLTGNDCLALLDSEKKITEEGLKHSSAKMLPPETILMSSRASIGFFGMHDKPACTNQGFISLIPRDERFRYFLLYHLMHRKEEIVSHAGGTTYKEINKSTFRALPIVLPGVTIAAEFAEFAGDVMQQVRVLKRQSAKLCEARDLLLPRLMNGEITV